MFGTADLFKSVDPVKTHFFGLGAKKAKVDYEKFVKVEDTEDPIRYAVEYGGHRQFALKAENTAVTLGAFNEGPRKSWRAATYAGGYVFSHEAIKDSRLREIKGAPEILGRAGKQTPDYLWADFLDNAFTQTNVTADGKAACATDHLLPDGVTTAANELATPAALEEEAIQDIITLMMDTVAADNMKVGVDPDKLVVPTPLWHIAEKIKKTPNQVGGMNNDKNVVADMFEPVVFRKLTNTTQWFMTATNLPSPADGLFMHFRERLQFITDNMPMGLQKLYISFFRCYFGLEDWRGLFGSAATS